VVLDQGRVVLSGEAALMNDFDAVRDVYLGRRRAILP